MQKTINIDGKDVRFSFNLASFYVFKNQFGYDGMTRLLPVIGEMINALDPKVFENKDNKASKDKKEDETKYLLNSLGNIFEEQTYFEITELANLIWAFAKTADKSIPVPELWYEEFSEFPIYDIGKELLPCIYESLISKKKMSISTQKEKKK